MSPSLKGYPQSLPNIVLPRNFELIFSEEKTLSDKSQISPVLIEEISNVVFEDNPTQRHYSMKEMYISGNISIFKKYHILHHRR